MRAANYKGHRDANEAPIVTALRDHGAIVHLLSDRGVPDLLVGYEGQTHLIEVKGLDGSFTPAQRQFLGTWKGKPVTIAITPEMALGVLR